MARKRRRRTKKVGFYERRTRRKREGAASDEEELRRRLREAVYRTPEEKRLLMEALRVLSGGKESKAQETAERMREVFDALGEQFAPEGSGE